MAWTPAEFERHAGLGTSRKWRNSIKVLLSHNKHMSISTWLAHYEHQRMLQQLAQQQQAAIQRLSQQQGPYRTAGAAGFGPQFAANPAPGLLQLLAGTYCGSTSGTAAGLDGPSIRVMQSQQTADGQLLGAGGVHAGGGWGVLPWAPQS